MLQAFDGSLGAMYGDDYFRLRLLTDTNINNVPSNKEAKPKGPQASYRPSLAQNPYNKKESAKRKYEDYKGYFIDDEWRKIYAAY
nr:hypothetical protein [Thermovirga lienii]